MADNTGRKPSLVISALGMGITFFIIGAILKTHPVVTPTPGHASPPPPPSSKAMAAMLYIYVCFYSMGWGPLPWVYVADIFPTRTRHYGLAVASGSQWLWSTFCEEASVSQRSCVLFSARFRRRQGDADDRDQPGVQVVHAIWHDQHWRHGRLFSVRWHPITVRCGSADESFRSVIPETKGRSLEEMDIIFGAVSLKAREALIEREERVLNDINGVSSSWTGDAKV